MWTVRFSQYISTEVNQVFIAVQTLVLQASWFSSATRVRFISAAYAILGHSSHMQFSDTDPFTSDTRAMDAVLYASLGASRDQAGRPCAKLTFGAMDAVLAAYSYHHVAFSRDTAMDHRL